MSEDRENKSFVTQTKLLFSLPLWYDKGNGEIQKELKR